MALAVAALLKQHCNSAARRSGSATRISDSPPGKSEVIPHQNISCRSFPSVPVSARVTSPNEGGAESLLQTVGKKYAEYDAEAYVSDSPRKIRTCIDSAYSKLVYEVIEKVEERVEQASTATSEFKSSIRKIIQSAYRLLHTIEMCQSMRRKLWIDGSTREVLMTVYMNLSKLLSSSSMQDIQPSNLEACLAARSESTLNRSCDQEDPKVGGGTLAMEEVFEWHSKLEACVAAVHQSTFALEQPCGGEDVWAGEESLAMEELFEWFADSLAATGSGASCHDEALIRSAPAASILDLCWEQTSKRSQATSSAHSDAGRSPSLSLGSVSTAASLGGISRTSSDSSSPPSLGFLPTKTQLKQVIAWESALEEY